MKERIAYSALLCLSLLCLILAAGCGEVGDDPTLPGPGEPEGDQTPPAAVSDLTVEPKAGTQGIFTLTWTAVADDGDTGDPASFYDLRYNTSPISAETWALATTYAHTWVPQAPQWIECKDVKNFHPGTRYYFALRVYDEEGNESDLSNVVDAVAPGDGVRPAQVTDLTAVPSTCATGAVDLAWTAVADDGSTGSPASSYQLRVSTTPITPSNWTATPLYNQTWTPGLAGATEHRRVYGLTPGATYYFALQVMDEVPNLSPLSNVPSAVAPGGWTWEQPRPTANSLNEVAFGGAGEGMAVGTSGTVLHYDGAGWWIMNPGTSQNLYGVWGSAAGEFFVVGQGGTILKYDGMAWTAMASPTTLDLQAVWGSSPSDVYALGYAGMFHYDGTAWASVTMAANDYLSDVWGTSSSDVWVVGYTATGWTSIQHFDGTSWTAESGTAAGTLSCVWGSSPTDVYAGSSGKIFHYDGTSWTFVNPGTTYAIQDIWGTGANDVYAVTPGGGIHHFDGTSWSGMMSGTTGHLYGVAGAQANRVFAVGLYGTLVEWDGTTWTSLSTGMPSSAVTSLFELSSTDLYAGMGPDVLHHDGTSWTVMQTGVYTTISDVWADSPTDVFAVGGVNGGRLMSCTREILHYDGNSWTTMMSGQGLPLTAVWGSSPTDVFAGGWYGVILHYDGTAWTTQVEYDGYNGWVYGLWGTSATDVFAVDSHGVIQHYDGTAWTAQTSGTTSNLRAVWGRASNDVYAVGSGGTVLHYDGTTWSPVTTPATASDDLYAVHGTAGGDLLLSGAVLGSTPYSVLGSVVLHCQGGNWTRLPQATTYPFHAACACADGSLLVAGQGGVILRWR